MKEIRNGGGLIALTRDEIDAIRREAYDKGFEDGRKEAQTRSAPKTGTVRVSKKETLKLNGDR